MLNVRKTKRQDDNLQYLPKQRSAEHVNKETYLVSKLF